MALYKAESGGGVNRSMAQCPKCRSSKVRFQREYAGSVGKTKYYRHHKKTSWLISSGSRSHKRTSQRKTIGLCQNCGYTWDVGNGGGNNSSGCGTIFIVLIVGFVIFSMFNKSDSDSGKKQTTVNSTESNVASSISSTEISTVSEEKESVSVNNANTEVWTYPTLADFDYEYKDGGINLTGYHGTGTSIVIPASYTVEGKSLQVLTLDNTFSHNKNVVNVAVSDGVQTILSNTFYDCPSLKHLFIPASVTGMSSSLTAPEDGEILYYGGNESQWDELRGQITDRSSIKFKQIVLNAVIDECLNNINTEVSVDYEETGLYAPLSDFQYDYSADGLTLADYNGSERTVIIAPSYTVDGAEKPVIKLDNTFALDSVDTVIVPEGVKELTQATFNSCGIKRLYLPKSATNVPSSFWGYFHDLDTLYYGGTEDEFNSLSQKDRFDIDVIHMEYEATPEMALKGN